MKVLRIRRGFTTNSSGSNEFLPAAGGADAQPQALVGQPAAPPATAPPGDPNNGLVLALVGAALALVFAGDRAVRALLRRRREDGDAVAPPPE